MADLQSRDQVSRCAESRELNVTTHLFELFLVASLVRVVQTSERLERRPHLRFTGPRE